MRTGGLAALCVALMGCEAGDAPSASAVADWSVAAERVKPSIHSVWGSQRALDGTVRAFSPVGTAFAVSREGLVLTNAHVVTDVEDVPHPRLSVLVQTDTGNVLYGAALLAIDDARDLALLGIVDTTLVPVRWAVSPAPVGTPLATFGYGLPEGGIVDTVQSQVKTRFTVFRRFTAGYSSGYRTLVPGDPSTNVLEVDLFLFPGVSGGPTFDLEGRVVGVNRGHRQLGAETTSYGHVIPRLVVGQFLEAAGSGVGADSATVFGVGRPRQP